MALDRAVSREVARLLRLFSAEICPFAQRVRALLTHLGEPFEVLTVDLSNRDPDFLEISPTGKIPLLLDGELMLYESQVILEYLAEKLGWRSAFASDPRLRARQRLAMKQWDGAVINVWYRSVKEPWSLDARARGMLEKELDQMARTIQVVGGAVESLPAFHCAPFWARMEWLRDRSPMPALIDARPALKDWLDRAVAIPTIQQTLPDRERAVKAYLSNQP